MAPSIAIVTISLNQARFLRNTMCSISNQSRPPDQWIVVDGGSEDGSLPIIREFEPDISTLVVGQDSGPVDALNRGLDLVSTDLVMCVNAGDGLLARALEVVSTMFDSAPPDILLGSGIVIDERDGFSRPFVAPRFSARRYVLGAAHTLHQATVYRASVVERLGGFDVACKSYWDGDLLVRAHLAGVRIARSGTEIGVVREHAGALSTDEAARAADGGHQARLFERAMGRSPSRSDTVRRWGLRAERLVTNPRYTYCRLRGRPVQRASVWPWW